jgi:hypothetical protein
MSEFYADIVWNITCILEIIIIIIQAFFSQINSLQDVLQNIIRLLSNMGFETEVHLVMLMWWKWYMSNVIQISKHNLFNINS